jgi:2-oxoglutarate dehydrogenase E1 component
MSSTLPVRSNADLIEANYELWKKDPASVNATWSAFFEGFELGNLVQKPGGGEKGDGVWQSRVDQLVHAYRSVGHTKAHLDPLSEHAPEAPLLTLEALGFSEKDLDRPASTALFANNKPFTLRGLIQALEEVYCRHIGVEYAHIQNPSVREWVRQAYETLAVAPPLPADTQKQVLRQILSVESFEKFLHTRFVGQKRFSMEGGESLMVALYSVLEHCPQHGVEEIVMGMAHRGRLSVINEFLQKPISAMFAQFSENYMPDTVAGDGDVKYHLGYRTKRELPGGQKVSIRLASNPSHLEAVNAVVGGIARARQSVRDDEERAKVVPVLVHGDAAFAGQGVVAETLNMSQLEGYRTGGTIHLVVNNQIGFTTLPADARSSRYCTDIGKMIDAPVFHINGDDPVAVRRCAALALEYRQKFKSDVILDIVCYRRHGHNEGDEPLFTQPVMYRMISAHPPLGTSFRKKLLDGGLLSPAESAEIDQEFQARYDSAFLEVKEAEQNKELDRYSHSNVVFQPSFSFAPVETAISKETLDTVCRALTTLPEGFHVLPRLKKMFLDKRENVWKEGGPYDWAFGEALAFGSLVAEGTPVRLSGQDCRRGTFSHRHAVLYDERTRERYVPLKHVVPGQVRFNVYNSLLSEAAVLGFEYGYTLHYPELLVLWEAQFGDFSNGAQIVIDQFLAAGESKWQRPSGLVMLLPHGYEGQGPEHSSARLERFLQLCAEENMQVCNFTTPAQYFHALRRQMKRAFRKPLVVMTPKSLLRAPECVSVESDFTSGTFEEILPGPLLAGADKVNRVILCSGKVYYDLLKFREANRRSDTALVRLEQLYPLHREKLAGELKKFKKAKTFVWCQEESRNMGAWSFLRWDLSEVIGRPVHYAGRETSSSPAVGALSIHKLQQAKLVEEAFLVG